MLAVVANLPAHGTRYRYNHRTDPCRCPRCRKGNAAYMRAHRAERRTEHVTDSGRPYVAIQRALPLWR
jgi:hypothetical protein